MPILNAIFPFYSLQFKGISDVKMPPPLHFLDINPHFCTQISPKRYQNYECMYIVHTFNAIDEIAIANTEMHELVAENPKNFSSMILGCDKTSNTSIAISQSFLRISLFFMRYSLHCSSIGPVKLTKIREKRQKNPDDKYYTLR